MPDNVPETLQLDKEAIAFGSATSIIQDEEFGCDRETKSTGVMRKPDSISSRCLFTTVSINERSRPKVGMTPSRISGK